MTIRMSEVKAVCTANEVALVQASRNPLRDRLTLTEAKRHVVRARKLFDKWQDQSRAQSRVKSRKIGHGEVESRSTLKTEIFGDALRAFEARVSKLEAAGAKPTGGRSKNPPKADRARTHRATRAEVRADLAEAQLIANKPAGKPKPARKPKPVAKVEAPPAPVATPPAAEPPPQAPAAGKTTKSRKALVPRPKNTPVVNAKRQLKAQAAAKQSRIARSGATTRVYGHISSRGKRSQGRRDSRK
jgi:hypothetical protein